MSIWYKYLGISEEVLLVPVLLLSGLPPVLLSEDPDLLLVLLSEDPDLPLVPLPDGSWVFFLYFMNS
jgi:hypothetical protein